MASYKIYWKQSAIKDLKKLSKQDIPRILRKVEELAGTPYPPGVRKLIGTEHTFRVRVGNYRIVYSIESCKLIIEIIRIAHRKDIYKNLP
ncbi:MAG: type II toxin-antitoxin system RelE/ParE family toxin [Caldiserica bacterium]|nr:type II toxin-antitoxin system RelE/ParE family toxin [Caldisericota bacterium]